MSEGMAEPQSLEEFRCKGYDTKRGHKCRHLLLRYTGHGTLIESKCPKCGTLTNLDLRAVPGISKEEPQDGQ